MTQRQLSQIVAFSKPYYKATGAFHAWDHIVRVQRLALKIAEQEFPQANKLTLKAAATLHDVGRIIKDDGHPLESGKIAKPFLQTIGLSKDEIENLLDAFIYHEVGEIDKAKTLEARIVFDADKIDILSTYGFMRVWYWLMEERKMPLSKALHFLWDYCERFYSKLYSKYAKNLVKNDLKVIRELIKRFDSYEQTWSK